MGTLKKFLPDMLAVMTFVIIAFVYFLEPATKGKVLTGHDHDGAVGSGVEMQHYKDTHNGERTRWTNSLFSGMPTYQMAPSYDSTDTLSKVQKVYQLWLPNVVGYVFMMMLGFYIMLRAFNFKTWMAALGAVLWAFSSYYFIIIAAGHIWKVLTLCFIPPTIGGIVLCYRGKRLSGIAVTGIFTALQILSNHIQMTYYFGFVIGFMMLAFLLNSLLKGRCCDTEEETENEKQPTPLQKPSMNLCLLNWVKATGCAFIGILLGVLVNLSNLYHTWEYSKESMRGKSELTSKTKDAADQTDGGLDRSYITQYSYGVSEIFTLMVPNAKGGSSLAVLADSKTAMKKANSEVEGQPFTKSGENFYQVIPQYFGNPKKGDTTTSGPVYIGAFVCFLFVLGLLIVKGPMKWCLLAATLLSVFLSFGKNMMWFTNIFIDFMPMYDKFRTVESILVIAEFTMPLLGLLALKKIVDRPAMLHEKATMRKVYISLALTAGLCFIMWVAPSIMGPFVTEGEQDIFKSLPPDFAAKAKSSLIDGRQAIVAADAMRSFLIIMIGFAALMVYRTGKLKSHLFVSALTVLCLFDMWMVNKRYLNDKMFVPKQTTAEMFAPKQADNTILQDKALDYRVLDYTAPQGVFNDNTASALHKSIGGYHAAKLRRYQELIDAHISKEYGAPIQAFEELAQISASQRLQEKCENIYTKALSEGKTEEEAQAAAMAMYQDTKLQQEILQQLMKEAASSQVPSEVTDENNEWPVLNMLNTKYFILHDQIAVKNASANGNAWFVDEVKYVDNADDELAMLGKIDNKHEAVADKKFESVLGQGKQNTVKKVEMTSYEANELQYEVESTNGGVLVFSEIYYPGWMATVDGQEVEIGRVDYVLRAIKIDGGKHQIVLKFDPQSVHTTDTIAYIALIALILMLIAPVAMSWIQKKRKEKATNA